MTNDDLCYLSASQALELAFLLAEQLKTERLSAVRPAGV